MKGTSLTSQQNDFKTNTAFQLRDAGTEFKNDVKDGK